MPSVCDKDIDDIEDIIGSNDLGPNDRLVKKNIVPRVRKKKSSPEVPLGDSIIPGTQSVYVKTWGCAHNNSDGEYMAGQLATYGYNITDDGAQADLWLLNSCTVKNPAEHHFMNEVQKAKDMGKEVVVAGCVPQGQPKADYLQGLSVIGVQQIDRVVEVVEEALKGHTVRLFGSKKKEGKKTGGAPLSLPKIRKNPLIEIIAINTGCLNQCTYCKTKHARGELGSYPPEEIIARAKQSFEEGVVEIWLTSEDTGAYGRDIGVTLPDLLWQLVETIPEGARLRLGMTNPPYILEHLEEMAKILNHPRVYSFLHVPVQSGSDSVLMDMKREYCSDDFRQVADFLKERVPGITIATDLICGFPTETDEDFEDSLKLVREYQFPSLFINQFFARPGTPAAKMVRVATTQQVKGRTKAATDAFMAYMPYDQKLGERQQVLVTEVSHDKQYYVGHNKYYDQVLIPKDENLMGTMVEVDIVETGKHYMKAVLVKDSEAKRPVAVPPPLKQGQVSGLVTEEVVISSNNPVWLRWTFAGIVVAIVVRLLMWTFSVRRYGLTA